eukprot:Colp12_sorted_trinity150504_noHs@18632
MQIILQTLNDCSVCFECDSAATPGDVHNQIATAMGIPATDFSLVNDDLLCESFTSISLEGSFVDEVVSFSRLQLSLDGGIDFQHREGSKIGSGGQMSESQAALERKERLRKLALETIDITKDPYITKNNLGTFECKLCLTVHPNEGNYLAHTQGKRHQYNLGRRAAMVAHKEAPKRNVLKIGRPGYKVTKSRDLRTMQRALTFEVEFPEAEAGTQPRHRFMSAFEQKIEVADKNFQYVLFACDPYETIAFKIPNHPIDRREGRFFTNWDAASHKFVLQLYFQPDEKLTTTAH